MLVQYNKIFFYLDYNFLHHFHLFHSSSFRGMSHLSICNQPVELYVIMCYILP